MSAFVYETGSERAISGALALVMHLMFLMLLVFGVSWQKHHAEAIVAELWSGLPSPPAPPAPKVEPPPLPPPPKVEPKPAPKAEPKPVPKVEPKPPPPKADIDLREKQEKARLAKEKAAQEKKRREALALAEKKRREELALAEKKRKEEQARLEAVRVRKEKEAAEAQRLAREQQEALRRIAQQEQAARAKEIDRYRRAIEERIKRFIVKPPNIKGKPVAELDIVILPGGEVLDVRTRKGSGQTPWDNACERAIRRAQPLPIPPAGSPVFSEFRELKHACRY